MLFDGEFYIMWYCTAAYGGEHCVCDGKHCKVFFMTTSSPSYGGKQRLALFDGELSTEWC